MSDLFSYYAQDPDCLLAVDAQDGGSWWSTCRPGHVDTGIYGMIYDPAVAQAAMACTRVEYDEQTDSLYLVKAHRNLPAHRFRRCVMDDLAARHVNYYLDESDSNKKEDGTPSDLTGPDGDVMVEIPIVHWRVETLEDGRILYLVSDRAFAGSEIHPYFYVSPGGATARTQYVGAFHAVICNSAGAPISTDPNATSPAAYIAGRRARTVAGGKPYGGMSAGVSRTAAWVNNTRPINSLFKQFLQLMMYIEGGSLDVQTAISPGFVHAKRAIYRYTRFCGRTAGLGNGTGNIYADPVEDANVAFSSLFVNGVTYYRDSVIDANGYFGWNQNNVNYYTDSATPANGSIAYKDTAGTLSGYTTSGYSVTAPAQQIVAFSYRGVENPYGEIFEYEDGIVVDVAGGAFYWTADTIVYGSADYLTVYNRTDQAWPSTSGWPKTWDAKSFFALTLGGGAATYLGDYLNSSNNSARVVYRGGFANSGTQAGPGCLYINGALATYASATVGARLAC